MAKVSKNIESQKTDSQELNPEAAANPETTYQKEIQPKGPQQYRVLVLGLSGKSNKVYKDGDLITASQVEANIDDLVKGGYVEPA